MKRDLGAVDWTIVGEQEFDGNIETGIVVGMSAEIERDWKRGRNIKKNVNLREVLLHRRGLGSHSGKLLETGNMISGTPAFRFLPGERNGKVLGGS